MKTFDYETAWKELALPAYKQLPNAALVLIEETGLVSENLHQNSACNMVWPDDGGKLREMFERLDINTLATAAHVSYCYSHWRPGKSIAGDAPTVPGGWKFANYADQVLRVRFNAARDVKSGVGLLIHEGTIRVGYSSSDMWTWHEIAPATQDGHAAAVGIADQLRRKIAGKRNTRSEREADNAAYAFMEELKKREAWPGWSIAPYMLEESELKLRQAARMPKPDKAKLIAELQADFEKKRQEATTERDGFLWLLEHDIPTGNCIYYSHTGRFCFGWRGKHSPGEKYEGKTRLKLLELLKGFPFEYDVE